MEINVDRIEIEIQRLNRIIREYENNYLNIKKCFNSISFFWKDGKSPRYFDELYENHKQMDITLIDLKELSSAYKYLATQYKKIGKKISYIKSNRNKVLMMLDQYSDDMTDIIRMYDEVNTYNIDNRIVILLEKERRRIINNKNMIISYRDKLTNLFNNLETIEQKVNRKLKKIDVTILSAGN